MHPIDHALRQFLLPGLILLAAPGMASEQPVPFTVADYVFHPFGWQAGPDGFLSTGHRKMQALYPNPDDWVRETAGRLTSWGFNRLGGHASEPMVHQGLSHSRFVGIGTPMAQLGDAFDITPNEGRPCSAFPNVFHPDFDAYCRYQAEVACRPSVGDPWLFGYFLDNELAWWGRADIETGLFEAVMKKPATHTAKIALRDFLAKKYNQDIEALNTAWGMQLASFDAILGRNHLDGSAPDTVRSDQRAFLALIAQLYFDKTTAAIRAIDPDHLILGCRFAGGHASDVVWAAAAKHCDVLSLNYYGNVDLDRGVALDDNHTCRGDPLGTPFAKFAKLARHRPLLVTEWSFIALDSGLPCTNGAGQRFRTQAERAKAAGIFAESLLRIPSVIGFDYFMWADEPTHLRSLYFQVFSALGGVAANDQPASLEHVPRLWGVLPGDAWIDETANAYVGITVPRHVPLEGRFWLNDQGGQHPDIHWVTERILSPGESLVPSQPVYAVIAAGRGGRLAWDARLQMSGLK